MVDRLRRLVVLCASVRGTVVEGEPFWYGRGMDANGAKLTVFMQHENIIGYPDYYVRNP